MSDLVEDGGEEVMAGAFNPDNHDEPDGGLAGLAMRHLRGRDGLVGCAVDPLPYEMQETRPPAQL